MIATGASGLEVAGTVQALVVEEDNVGLRLALSEKYSASPDGFVTAAEAILAQR